MSLLDMAYSPESIVAISILLPSLAVVFLLLRFFVRQKLARTYIGLDDWLLVAACFLALADGANLAVGMIDATYSAALEARSTNACISTAATLGFQGRVYEGSIPHQRAVVEARVQDFPFLELGQSYF